MRRVWQTPVLVLTGSLITAMSAMPQATISARPGVINYIEGTAYQNGEAISPKKAGNIFLNANDTLSTDKGKVEILLTPGVFLRVGDNSAVKMISPSLTNTQIEITKGETMLEVADLVKDSDLQIINHGGTTRVEKTGLYRFAADDAPTAAVIQGKARVEFGDKKVQLGKQRQTIIGDPLKSTKFDVNKDDDLYAWSNVRDEYVSAASFASARTALASNAGSGSGGLGYGGLGYGGLGYGYGYGPAAPGWFWNSAFNSWAWLPGDGAFFSPFGYGFFAPAYIGYAPLMYRPVNVAAAGGKPIPVPVNPNRVPPASSAVRSPGAAMQASRAPVNRQAIVSPNGQAWRSAPASRAWAGQAPGGAGHVSGTAIRSSAAPAAAARSASPSYSGGVRSGPSPMSSAPRSAAPSGGGRR